ncbi:MAG: MBOAT family protein, partial [Firmicutes bacterium]|nr:MBOAT family protein [Bacillota bacterium]
MVFSSLTFLFFFLAVTITAYVFVPGRTGKNAVLLIASLVFYAWGEPRLVALMVLVAVVAYGGGLLIDACERKGRKTAKTIVYILTVVLIASNLLYFKYLNFFADNIGALFGRDFGLARIALPIGISFYTFQILSYVIDLYRGNVGVQRNFFRLLLYLCFFPQLIAGPIVRYATIEKEITDRKESLDDMTAGARRFCVGLAKKVLIANGVAQLAEIIYAGDPAVYGTGLYWIAALAYT